MMNVSGQNGTMADEYNHVVHNLLGNYGLTCICPSTVYNWMKKLGFKCECRKIGYNVDGHEKPAAVE